MTFIQRDPYTLIGARVDSRGRAETHSTSRTQAEAQSELGLAFVLNTKDIQISSDSALLYIKNNHSSMNLHATFLAMGVGVPSATFAGAMTVEVQAQIDTSAQIVVDANTTLIKANQRIGHSNTFPEIDSFFGADGYTITGGTPLSHATQPASPIGGRLSIGLTWVMPPGSRVCVSVLPNLASGTVDVNITVVGYLDEPGD